MKWFIFILSLGAFACSGKVVITEAEIKPDVFYTDNDFRPFTGKCIIVYRDTSLKKEQFIYRRGRLDGEALSWYKNGQIRWKGTYRDGKIWGKWEFWDKQGNKITSAYYENDLLNGPFTVLYKNGKIKEKGIYSNNKRTGIWSCYSEVGQLLPAGTIVK